MKLFLRLFVFTLCSCLVTFCNQVPLSDFHEVDGIVSGQIDESLRAPNWSPVYYVNSRGLTPDHVQPDSSDALLFTASISNIGNYSFWMLTTTTGNSGSRDTLDITVKNEEQHLVALLSVEVSANHKLQWIQAEAFSENNLFSFEETGVYSFSIHPRGAEGVQVHKIQLSHENRVKPFGLGLPSSTRVDLSAADLFREQPVMLPPAWVFKPILGLKEPSAPPEYLSETVGGIWLDLENDNVQNTDSTRTFDDRNVRLGLKLKANEICNNNTDAVFKSEFQFIVTTGTTEIQCLKDVYDTYRQFEGRDYRPVVFHGLKNGYDPRSKRHPAPVTPLYQFEWSAERKVQDGILKPGGYRQLVEDISNPTNSLYNTPFLSLPINYSSGLQAGSEWDSELFNRTIQLAAFLPVMQIEVPKVEENNTGFFDQLSESELQQLNSSFNLRSALFPYHYTHAHYTRQRNESIITGFREHPDQFMYGDAFLVAPVLEEDADGRIIFFPEGRWWYSYYTGDIFEAGRSWFVETDADRIPLFVKAGSVIPYKMAGEKDHLKVEVYSGDAGSFRLVEDDGQTRGYRRTEAARTMFRYNEVQGRQQLTIGAVQAGFEGMTEERSYNLHFKFTDLPDNIIVNDEKIERTSDNTIRRGWRYEESDREVIIFLKNQSKYEKLDIVIAP